MNARHRGEAMDALESMGFTIALHLALVAFYPNHEAINHWGKEIRAFRVILQRMHRGKGGRKNYYPGTIADELEAYTHGDERELIREALVEKGFTPGEDWTAVRAAMAAFELSVLESCVINPTPTT